VKVLLRNPRRELDVVGPIRVLTLLERLELNRESVLVVRGSTLVPGDALLADTDEIEIRPVISGGDGPLPALRGGAEQQHRRPTTATPELPSPARPLGCDGS
jgi:sulfur carrier protein